MGYYTRVLSKADDCIPVRTIEEALRSEGLSSRVEVEVGSQDDWEQLILMHPDGLEIASIERNVVENGSLGEEEIHEFLEEIKGQKPDSAVEWLLAYLPSVRCINAFQHLSGTEKKNGSDCLSVMRNTIWRNAPGILQADYEGFSNEDAYQILWQFSDSVSGDWWMGVLENNKWIHFKMDLGNPKHRESFMAGLVPEGSELA